MGDMSREPSMEEILSSIRRVIARDEAARDDALEARFGDSEAEAEAAAAAPEEGDDILDLTELEASATDGAVADVEAMPAPATPDAELVSADSADAARQSIGQLTAALSRDTAPAAASNATMPGMTIEALAEAALKPMLKEWLDNNLPPLVERLVAREIARITGGKI
jgi:uncharacterized protein